MKKTEYGLFSNCVFLLKFAYHTNRAVFFIKVPQILINAVTPFIPILFLRLILNEITIGRDMDRLVLYVVLLAVATLVTGVLTAILNYFMQNQMELTVRKIKNRLGNIVMEMPYSDAEQPKIRDFITLAQDGTNFSQVLDYISSIITSFLTIAGVAAIIITIQPIIFLFIALVVVTRLFADKKNRKLWDKWRPRYASIMRKQNYYTRVIKRPEFGKEVRLNNLQDWIYDKADAHSEVYLDASTKHNKEIQRNNILSSAVSILQEGVVYLILAYKVVFQAMTIGDFSMYTSSVSTFSNNIRSIVTAISSVMQTGLFVKDFRYCIEIADKSKKADNAEVLDLNPEHVVLEFRHVSFRYPNTDKYVLKDISLILNSKSSLSIVGVNGSGKTTMVKLLCRMYEPTQGEILLNGININRFSYDDYIRLIGAVFQDFKLFSFTVKENVSLGGDCDEDQVTNALRKIGLGAKIERLPKGLDTNINKEFDSNGIEFSGGEAQKLAMARTLCKNAPVIILDEPTAALDPIAEAEIYSKFNELTRNKTAIYISHRLSSCKFCDKIAVLDHGEIVQYGSHKDLMEEGGLYAKMWNMQAQYYVEV